MFRTTDIVLIAVMVSAAGFTYTTKHDAEAELAKVRKLEMAIRFEEETIDILKADWSLLTQPSRLQKLADQYYPELHLVEMQSHQIAEINQLPTRSMQVEDLLGGWVADAGVDEVTTGSINPSSEVAE